MPDLPVLESERRVLAQSGGARNNDRLRDDWLRLAFVGLPAGRCASALARWSTPGALLEAAAAQRDDELLSTKGITPVTVERLREAATRDLSRAHAAMEEFSIRLLLLEDDEYPAALRAIDDPPPVLFVRGEIQPRDEIAVAIVGTRHATEYGRGLAHKFGRDLAARGVTVVSGLARGVDTAAHRGALEGGGRTFAVCGCGLDVAYPSENKKLMEEIAQSGAVFSEFAPTVHPEAWHFPARNRIISGLSCGTIVVEAAERSGALITADFALEQSREVFAVPGNIHKGQSKGCHALIKQGATLVENVDDIIGALNNRTLPFATENQSADQPDQAALLQTGSTRRSTPEAKPPADSTQKFAPQSTPDSVPKVRPDLTPNENRVYLVLEIEPRHIDDLAQSAKMSAGEINAALVMLEIKGAARRLPGNAFARVS
jgi:DNA processing protein